MHDVQEELHSARGALPWIHSASQPLFDLAYADDTLLMGTNVEVVQTALHSLQKIAKCYNLQLNKGKCELIRMFTDKGITFLPTELHPQGEAIKVVAQAKYLGVILTASGSASKDVEARITKAQAGMNSLAKFWAHSSLTKEWKIRVYKGTFIPMILYGMDTASLTAHNIQRLETFHHRALRRILGLKSTHYTKNIATNTNTTTISHADVRTLADNIPSIAQLLSQSRMKLLGHILRSPNEDLMKSTCLDNVLKYRTPKGKNRGGRPNLLWIDTAVREAWDQLLPMEVAHTVQGVFSYPTSILPIARLDSQRLFWRTEVVSGPTRFNETVAAAGAEETVVVDS